MGQLKEGRGEGVKMGNSHLEQSRCHKSCTLDGRHCIRRQLPRSLRNRAYLRAHAKHLVGGPLKRHHIPWQASADL